MVDSLLKEKKERLLGSNGYEWTLGLSMEKSRAAKALAGGAFFDINEACECYVVGFDEPAQRLLTRAEEWIVEAIRTGEIPNRYFPNAMEAMRAFDLAFCRWLLRGEEDMETIDEALQFEALHRKARKQDKVDIGMSMPYYLAWNKNQGALDLFKLPVGLKPPKNLNALTVSAP